MTLMVTGAGLVGAQVAALDQANGGRPVLFDLAPRHDALAEFVDPDRCASCVVTSRTPSTSFG